MKKQSVLQLKKKNTSGERDNTMRNQAYKIIETMVNTIDGRIEILARNKHEMNYDRYQRECYRINGMVDLLSEVCGVRYTWNEREGVHEYE